MPTNLHKKLFQSDGTAKLLRPDIIPWTHYEAPSDCSVIQSRQTISSDSPVGTVLQIESLKYLPGRLLVFLNGVKLSPGIGFTEGEADTDGYCDSITLGVAALEGDSAKFVAHDGVAVNWVTFRYTVAPEAAAELSYCPLDPSRLAEGTSVSIDWGDGTSETLEAGSSETTPTHTYATSDKTRYQITLKATDETWLGVTAMFFGTSTTVSLNAESEDVQPYAIDHASSRVRYLVSVDDPLPVMGFTTRAYMFDNNRLLETLPSDLFANQAAEITSFKYCFYYCLSLETVPEGLFAGCTNAHDFSHCFDASNKLSSIPGNLFSGCFGLESLDSALYGCSSISSFELDLSDVKDVTSADGFANGCGGSSSDHVLLLDCESVTAATFESASNANVWSECWGDVSFRYTVAPESTSSLSYCPLAPSRLADGTSIDIDWGDGSTDVLEADDSTTHPTHAYSTDDGTRYQITLTAPAATWAGVTSMFFGTSTTVSLNVEPLADDQTSAKVRYLVSVDDPLPKLESTTRANMFYNNRLLESIPSGLFKKQASSITSFYNTFYRCESLAEVPEGLFDGCYSATTFACVFQRCSALATIPDGLFANCSAATTFSDAFQYCDALHAMPEDMFAGCSAATDFSYCFQYCGDALSFTLDLTDVNSVTNARSFCPDGDAAEHVLVLTCGSTSASTFKSATDANVTSDCF